ncbi:MAG TPA: carboxypeptidase regulatory-like domain-containing protein [Candidatus Sulfopaludibacter sp.]|jgi:hypothetical protein|nr:carboxypeptidase regulatory-like domain-containing protein [Candidatus Sulfopaludibacter sp.]
MKPLILLLAAFPALAAITGTVTNQTTGKPAANVTVTLYKFGGGGMEPVDHVQTDAQGAFSINQAPAAQGPSMVRVEQDGVTYNKMMPPGTPTTNLAISIYNASKQAAAGAVSKHMLLFEPNNGQITVNETILYKNDGKTTWSDPQNGTLKFFLPAGAESTLDVKGSAPDGMPVPVPTQKTAQPNIYAAKFEIKPGETRFDLTYSVPYTEGATYSGKIATNDENTYLIVPNGVTLDGQNLKDLGQEPRTQARIFGLQTNSYSVKLSGAAVPTPDAAAADQPDNSGPQIEQIMPRIYTQLWPILGITLGVLALGFILLYRSKEPNERGRN